MKYLMIFICVLSFTGCASTSEWKVNTVAMEREVSKTLQLYPSQTDYRILIVPDRKAVTMEHKRIYGRETDAPAFYSSVKNLIVIPRECEIRILRHEIGHAVVRAYFKAPVPSWLHEELARKAEVSAPES
ncbi:hypothetical protein [Desulfoluna spongiiphila]|uniref:Lipoprotein n=1 Tax=Desulfoluna spongiiphila TaxID=419481 RepID=A0A1G5GSA3_9BACT|nr:hypothetical protein [Desulfoluna spongiiphila]SCY54291.1 hypothetical protein SAMN05216233_11196 [Desulfoluna spongiiphila]